MIFQGSFTFFHGFGQLFLVVFVQQYPIQAEQQQSKTLGTSQNVPTWTLSWPQDPACEATSLGRLWPSDDADAVQ